MLVAGICVYVAPAIGWATLTHVLYVEQNARINFIYDIIKKYIIDTKPIIYLLFNALLYKSNSIRIDM